jgi:hypothetical protein
VKNGTIPRRLEQRYPPQIRANPGLKSGARHV